MPMLCLAGAFHVTGTEPDGDSLRFRPDDPAQWDAVPGPVRRNASGAAQLRLDGIDALETHYTPVGAALLWTLQQGLGEAFTPEVKDAWATAYIILSTTMIDAANEKPMAA